MPSILRIPKVQVALTLALIYLSALIKFPTSTNFYLLIMSVVFTALFDLLFTYFRKRTLFIPYAAIVTGLILAIIVDQSLSWFQIAIVSALAMGVKNFLRISGRHIFNPVASGLFLGSLIFNQFTASWWAASFQNIVSMENLPYFLILLTPAVVSIYRLKKYYMMLTFFAVNLILTSIFYPFSSLESITSKLFDPSTIFFLLVMLPEPMTSPVNWKMQLFYGGMVAAVPFILSVTNITSLLSSLVAFDSLLFALLLGNLIFSKNK